MTMSVSIPSELQPFVAAEIQSGRFADEQEFLAAMIQLYREMKDRHGLLRARVQRSIEQEQRGELAPLDMDVIKSKLREELDESGQPK